MKNITAMVLVGGRGTRLESITKKTAKPAVTFGGKYKLIDFVLSNLSNSNIYDVGLITQYEPHELMDYIGHGSNWDLDVNRGGVSFLTPYTNMEGEVWQKGTAHAIKQHMRFLERKKADQVLILGGDHIYKMDYSKMIDFHNKQNADVTIASVTIDADFHRFGLLQSENGYVTKFEEKPEIQLSNKASMGIYIFNKKPLEILLNEFGAKNDFGGDIIPLALKLNMKVANYEFDGYFKDVGTITSLFEANMDLIDNPQLLRLNEYKELPIFTKSSNLPPHHIIDNSGIKNSYISDGCLIFGAIDHSIISAGCYTKKGSKIVNSIVHENVEIGMNTSISNCIVVKNTIIPDDISLQFKEITVIDSDYIKFVGDDHE